jgi:hypothetical protein
VDGSRRVFRAPDLVYSPPVHGGRTRDAAASGPRMGHHSR